MMHVFHVFAPFLPEARRANREIGEFIRAWVDAPAGHREGGASQPT